jgi:hypothetical protein
MPSPRVHVDFNDIEDDGRIGALVDSADDPSELQPGAIVTLWDEDGNTAQGRVAELADRGLVWIDLLRHTWRSHLEQSAHTVMADWLLTAVDMHSCTAGTASTSHIGAFYGGSVYTGNFIFVPAALNRMGHIRPRSEEWHSKVHSVAGVSLATAEVPE